MGRVLFWFLCVCVKKGHLFIYLLRDGFGHLVLDQTVTQSPVQWAGRVCLARKPVSQLPANNTSILISLFRYKRLANDISTRKSIVLCSLVRMLFCYWIGHGQERKHLPYWQLRSYKLQYAIMLGCA